MTPFAFMEQMAGGMQHKIGVRWNIESRRVSQYLGSSQNGGGMGLDARGFRQQVVMNIQHGAPADVGHRWQFMHPAPVVALIVVVLLLCVPAGQLQCGFDLAELARGTRMSISPNSRPAAGGKSAMA